MGPDVSVGRGPEPVQRARGGTLDRISAADRIQQEAVE